MGTVVTSSSSKMGRFVNPMWVKVVGWTICAVISGLNIYLLWDVLGPMWVIGGAAVMLGYGVFVWWWTKGRRSSEVAL